MAADLKAQPPPQARAAPIASTDAAVLLPTTVRPPLRAAVLRNPRAHGLRRGLGAGEAVDAPTAAPDSPGALREVLARWAADGVTRLVVDGGDGTVREVLTALPAAFGARPPEIAVLPSGKTNALAHDLGVPRRWSASDALRSTRTVMRAPLEVERLDGGAPVRRGFLFGAGAFTEAVALSQHLHAAGLFGGLAVGVALAASTARVGFGPASDPWKAGREMRVDGGAAASRFLLLMSTLERLPLGLKPFGPPGPGLKLLDVAAPPCRLAAALPLVLSGRDRPWLARAGYRRSIAEAVRVSTAAPFVLDGELFEGGDLLVRRGSPITFVTP